MFVQVETKDPHAVEREVRSIYLNCFPGGTVDFVPQAFRWASDCFIGKYADYQSIDARYHDFEHTLQGTLCLARLLGCRHKVCALPVVSPRMFELGLLAILFHDSGYLKKRTDTFGTGAKYTPVHVKRSAEFAKDFLEQQGLTEEETAPIQNMIKCTGVNADLKAIPFGSEVEMVLGYALGTADLLGQMAAKDYVDKLPILYQEFSESARFNPGMATNFEAFTSDEDLMQKTILFWEGYVKRKINLDFQQLYKFLADPYPDGPNWYLYWIEANMNRLRRLYFDSTEAAEQG